jgi:sporulation protein YlmC with PRC-barrel domain
MRRKQCSVFILLVATLWIAAAGTGLAAEPPGGAKVDVDRSGVHVDVGDKDNDRANAPVVKARDLIGVGVYNSANEKLGKIEELVANPSSGNIRYAVLSFGGFLGMGDKLFAVPWNSLKLVPKGTTSSGTLKEDYYVLDVDKDTLKSAPGFDKTDWPDFGNAKWSSDSDKFYRGRPASARRGGARVEVDRGGVRVDVGRKNDQANVPVVKVSDLIGIAVYSANGENIGKIEDLVVNPSSGHFRYSVLSFGGFLGMGDKLFAVPWRISSWCPRERPDRER